MPDLSAIRHPTFASRVLYQFGRVLLPLIGWRVTLDLPSVSKFVLIVHPHTSNWDLVIGLICGYGMDLLSSWPFGFMVKDSALRWPVIGGLIRALGGIGIDRTSRFNAVEQMTQVFARTQRLMLVITPEGTRRRTPFWKSGFYHIAVGAGLPIVPAYLDYRRRLAALGPALWPSGDVEADLEVLRAFYAKVTPLYPHEAGDIRLKPANLDAESQPQSTT